MALFWFLVGMLTMLAVLLAMVPWLRSKPRLAGLPAVPWPATAASAVVVIALIAVGRWLGHADAEPPARVASGSPALPGGASTPAAAADGAIAADPAAAGGAASGAASFGTAARVFGEATGANANPAGPSGTAATPGAKAGAGSMDSAIAALEARLAKGGGSADDWELLAKSFEFLGRPADAVKARARKLPVLTQSTDVGTQNVGTNAGDGDPAAAAKLVVSGEVTLAQALNARATTGETLFIIAKSVASPGIPVAVFRGSVGSWPLKFTLDDSQSMMPGRNLSSAGRVTIEARISQKGQPLPTAGDLQGSSGVIDPADHRPLKIMIDHVIT
jgi:cytochrome c-type biogenesis protein CcmH